MRWTLRLFLHSRTIPQNSWNICIYSYAYRHKLPDQEDTNIPGPQDTDTLQQQHTNIPWPHGHRHTPTTTDQHTPTTTHQHTPTTTHPKAIFSDGSSVPWLRQPVVLWHLYVPADAAWRWWSVSGNEQLLSYFFWWIDSMLSPILSLHGIHIEIS